MPFPGYRSVWIGLLLSCQLLAETGERWSGAERSEALRAEPLPAAFEALKALHTPLHPPGPRDWLSQHKESGQTYKAYRAEHQKAKRQGLTAIYILPIGDFTTEQLEIVKLTSRFMQIYFSLPVRMQPALSLHEIPPQARRKAEATAPDQLLTRYILSDLLKPRRPEDAVAYLALTAQDLWPGDGWNFVYGQASLRDRVGVWSLFRNGDPAESPEAYTLCLRRTLQTATHETGHLLGIRHCLAYECNMNGANHREEADRRPLSLCPSCLAKLNWRIETEPKTRFQKLILFCNKYGLEADCVLFAKEMVTLP